MLSWPRSFASPKSKTSFQQGDISALPSEDSSFDLVISNGVLNLVPAKDAAFREIHRVLRPGGTLAVADLILVDSVPPELLEDENAWSS